MRKGCHGCVFALLCLSLGAKPSFFFQVKFEVDSKIANHRKELEMQQSSFNMEIMSKVFT